IDVGHVQTQVLERVSDQLAASHRAYDDHGRATMAELEHLQRLGKLDQPLDVVGQYRLRTARVIDVEAVLVQQLRAIEKAAGADAGDLGGDVIKLRGDATCDEIGLVRVGDGNQHVRIFNAAFDQRFGMRGAADDGTQVDTILQLLQTTG